MSKFIPSIISIAVFLLVWWAISSWRIVNPVFLPDLPTFCRAVLKLITKLETYQNILQTVFRALAGLVLSALIGIPAGILFGRNKRLYAFFSLPFDFFRSVPSSALFPLFILFFGLGNISKIAIVFYGCFFILVLNTFYGARPSKERVDRINMLRSFGASKWQILRFSVFYDALPQIASGLRICISLSLVLVVVTEMYLGAEDGIGRQIYDFYLSYRIGEMYASILILGLVGFFSNKAFELIENKFIFWIKNN